MYHIYDNKVCITAEQFKEIFSPNIYDNGVKRGYFKKHGYGGNGREVHIEVESMRADLRKKVIEIEGPTGSAVCNTFIDSITIDSDIVDFFKQYKYKLGDKMVSLSEAVQEQYRNEAAILRAIQREIAMINKARQSKGKKLNFSKHWGVRFSLIHSDELKKTFPHKLPENSDYCRRKYLSFVEDGCSTLISGKHGNKNTEKINEEAKMWILATWANPVEKCTGEEHLLQLYNTKAVDEGWKKLKSSQTLHNFLFEPEIHSLWYGHRYGELRSKEKFTLFNSTKMPLLRDALWYSDGTKLNYFYLAEDGEIKTISVYEIMDVSSEFFLGYYIADKENFDTQFRAYKMALQVAGHKPYEIAYDNQGGHKKLEAGDFLSKLAHLSIRVKPYNGKSKTIESAFGRFQQQFLKRDWFFTGQNIQAKKLESKANMEFILANKMNLPSLDEIKKIYEKRRNEWNNAKHPSSGISRKETYYSSNNDKTPALQIYDMVNIFWVTRPSTIKYSAEGLCFTEGRTKYKYIKYTEPLSPDFDFHFNNIGREFVVKFDPEDMSCIFLYEEDSQKNLRFVTEMSTKVETFRDKQEQEDWEAQYISQMDKKNTEKRNEIWYEMENILRQEGKHAENYGLKSPRLKGVKNITEKKEKENKKFIKPTNDWEKVISNVTCLDDENIGDKMLEEYYNRY